MDKTKKTFRKRLNSGLHSTIIDGKRVTIRPGQVIECFPEVLGKHISQYEEIGKQKGKALSPLKAEIARIKSMMEPKSWILNPDWKPGNGQFVYVPKDAAGLRNVLWSLEREDFNTSGQALGEMSSVMFKRKTAWKAWEIQVKTDPLGRKKLNAPEGQYLLDIAEAEARFEILKAEIEELKQRIEKAEQQEEAEHDDLRVKLRFRGLGKKRKHRFVEMDGRPVEYLEGKPHFSDNGESVADYLEKCKEHRTRESKEKAAKAARERKSERQRQEGAAV